MLGVIGFKVFECCRWVEDGVLVTDPRLEIEGIRRMHENSKEKIRALNERNLESLLKIKFLSQKT